MQENPEKQKFPDAKLLEQLHLDAQKLSERKDALERLMHSKSGEEQEALREDLNKVVQGLELIESKIKGLEGSE